MVVRKATHADLDSVKSIADANRQSIGFVMRGALEEGVTRGWLLVAEQDGDVVGFAHYRHCVRLPHTTLYELCVTKTHRGQGYGKSLITAIRQEAQHLGKCIKLKTPVDLSANGFYAALGFQCVGTEQGKKRALNVWTLEVQG